MPSSDVSVTTPDGECPCSLHAPDGTGPWPAVIMYPDAGGPRASFREMADRLAGLGYVVLVPDVYYRSGHYEPFKMADVFTDPAERQRLGMLMSSLSTDGTVSDATAFADFLAAHPSVIAGPIGTTGYCMGGRISLTVAGHLGDRIGAAASFHGGRLAVEDDPASPHHLASQVTATVYVGAASDDASFGPDQLVRLTEVYEAAHVTFTIEVYSALHGFAVPDNPPFDETSAERHWHAMETLFAGLAH